MPQDNPPIIPDRSVAPASWGLQAGVLALALAIGGAAFVVYAGRELTLSHYDARAHLVVARRVVDSLTPGWRQFGAVWLPLPALLSLLPVRWDWAYRSGAVGLLSSTAALAWGLSMLAGYLHRRTGSLSIAVATPLVILLNPNVLYLQSTPMTEPLLLALTFAALAAVDLWVRRPSRSATRYAGWCLVALVMTRYEGWLVAGALVAVGAVAAGRHRVRASIGLALYPTLAVAAYVAAASAATGGWFLGTDFFVPENPSRHLPLAAIKEVAGTTADLTGPWLIAVGAAGALVLLVRAVRTREASELLPLALGATAVLPAVAFFEGHPHRDRYMVPLVAATAVLAALAVGALPARLRAAAAAGILVVSVWLNPPLSSRAPMVIEAQWETPFRLDRRAVSGELARRHDGTPILASMGSLAHYMQETSAIGLSIRDFLHEGNGDLWAAALASPRRHVRWILIEERAEGGDALAALARQRPDFLDGFRRVIDGGGLVLYERSDPQ